MILGIILGTTVVLVALGYKLEAIHSTLINIQVSLDRINSESNNPDSP